MSAARSVYTFRSRETRCTPNPLVVVHFEWYGRDGSFEEDHLCRLSSWVLINCYSEVVDIIRMSYCDRVGKHSEVEATLEDYSVRWAPDVGYDAASVRLDDDRFRWPSEDARALSDAADARLEAACLQWLAEQALHPGGYDGDRDPIPAWRGFVDTFKRTLAESPYAVAFQFDDAYHIDERKQVYPSGHVVESNPQRFYITFEDPRVAAYFYAARPASITFTSDRYIDVETNEGTTREVTFNPQSIEPKALFGAEACEACTTGNAEWEPPSDDEAWKEWSDHAPWEELLERAKAHVARRAEARHTPNDV